MFNEAKPILLTQTGGSLEMRSRLRWRECRLILMSGSHNNHQVSRKARSSRLMGVFVFSKRATGQKSLLSLVGRENTSLTDLLFSEHCQFKGHMTTPEGVFDARPFFGQQARILGTYT